MSGASPRPESGAEALNETGWFPTGLAGSWLGLVGCGS